MIDQRKFDELVDNTTKYLQDLMTRVNKLEAKVKELEKPKVVTKGGDK